MSRRIFRKAVINLKRWVLWTKYCKSFEQNHRSRVKFPIYESFRNKKIHILKSFRLYVNKFIIIIIPKASVYSYFQVGISTDNAFWRPTDWIFGYPSPPFASFHSICGFPANCSCEINCRQLFCHFQMNKTLLTGKFQLFTKILHFLFRWYLFLQLWIQQGYFIYEYWIAKGWK